MQPQGSSARNPHKEAQLHNFKAHACGACTSVQKEALPAILRSFELYGRLTRLEVSIMAINEDTKLEELERIKGELKELLPLLSKWRVEELQKLISHHYTTKWKHKQRLYPERA